MHKSKCLKFGIPVKLERFQKGVEKDALRQSESDYGHEHQDNSRPMFVRVSKSYIINVRQMDWVDNNTVYRQK